jgi:hypothetical protein
MDGRREARHDRGMWKVICKQVVTGTGKSVGCNTLLATAPTKTGPFRTEPGAEWVMENVAAGAWVMKLRCPSCGNTVQPNPDIGSLIPA